MNEEIEDRLRRIYSAMGEMIDADVEGAVRATHFSEPGQFGMKIDFRANMTDEQMANRIHTVVHNIANLQDHLKKWSRKEGKDSRKVDATFDASMELKVVKDLSNNDKHGYPPRDLGHSGLRPRLGTIERAVQLSSPGASMMFSMRDGSMTRTGEQKIVIEAEVLNEDGSLLGYIDNFTGPGLEQWERLFAELSAETIT